MTYQFLGGAYAETPPNSFRQPAPIYTWLFVNYSAVIRFQHRTETIAPNSVILLDQAELLTIQHAAHENLTASWVYFKCTDSHQLAAAKIIFNHWSIVPEASRLTTMLTSLLWEDSHTVQPYQAANENLLLGWLLNTTALSQQTAPKANYTGPYRDSLQTIRNTLIAHPERPWSAVQMADTLRISPSYFQHLYKTMFGISFQGDVIQLRISRAKELVRNTDVPFAQLAQDTGYASEVHFFRQFKQLTHMTPGEYRRLANK